MPQETLKYTAREISWIDQFGEIQNKTIEDFLRVSILQAVEINENREDVDIDELILKNNITLKSIMKWNSVTIEFILRKKDETKLISEFILTNTKLLNSQMR